MHMMADFWSQFVFCFASLYFFVLLSVMGYLFVFLENMFFVLSFFKQDLANLAVNISLLCFNVYSFRTLSPSL